MDAVLKIYGDIGEGGITSAFVSDFLDQNKESTNLTVRINSRGGDVSEGWCIHDLLVNSGKHIKTVGESQVYSIATVIFMAGTEREMMANADGLIHNPYIPGDNLSGDYRSSDLLSLADHMVQEESKILEFYTKTTGSEKDKLAQLMSADTKLSAEDMLTLGFATKILEPIKAFAYIKPNKYKMDEKEVKTWGEKLDLIIDKIKGLSRLPAKDQTMTDKDGKEFKLDKETGGPALGDKASPDGTFSMTDGKIVVISGGEVTEIKEAEVAKSELEIANEKITELEAKVALAETAKTEASKAKEEAEAEKVKAVALVTELQALKNTWKPESRTKFGSVDKVGDVDLNQVREIIKNQKSE
jgi:ATP-dependent protease ClpP protease subunit